MHRVRALRSSALSLIGLGAIALCPSVAAGAGGPAIPGGTWGGAGVTGPSGEPSSALRYVTIATGRGTTVEKIKVDGGVVRQYWSFDRPWTLPAVTLWGQAGGLSADGETLVLISPARGLRADETRFRILDTRRLQTRDRLTLDGRFSFDAISPDGRLMYLVQYPDPRDPLSYRVRAYDLAAREFRPGRIVDPEEPGEQMTGQPLARETSPDGRWAYTLYAGGEETFIHALDTRNATAACIDLDRFDGRNGFRLGLEVDPASGELTVLERGDPAAIVDPETFELSDPPATAAEPAGDQGGDGPPWALIGAAALVGAAGSLALFRRRRRRAADDGALERLVELDDDVPTEREDATECEPVP